MDEFKTLCFVDGDQKLCPCCMATMIVKQEITLDGLGDCVFAVATPGLICDRCNLPLARKECEEAVEKILLTLDTWVNNKPIPFKPPYAVETGDAPEPGEEPTPEEQEALERVARANENLNRALEDYRVAREAVLKAREEARVAGAEVDDTPIPEWHEIGED